VISEQIIIEPVRVKVCAIRDALACYRCWKKRKLFGTILFIADLIDYLFLGFVVARPTCFGMAKIIRMDDGPAWYVRVAVGDLRELLDALPCYLPRIAFCRRNDGRMRVYPLDRLQQLVISLGGK
jgi:hypothetical protein